MTQRGSLSSQGMHGLFALPQPLSVPALADAAKSLIGPKEGEGHIHNSYADKEMMGRGPGGG